MSDIEQIANNFERLTDEFNVPREFIYRALSQMEDKRPKKKRGAPFGNQNARKHGLYSKFLTPDRIEILDQAARIRDLSHEITIVRLKLDSLLADPNAPTDEVLKTVSILAKLISAQRHLS